MKKNIIIGVLAVALVVVSVLAFSTNDSMGEYKNSVEDEYESSFVLLIDSLRDMSTKMDKCSVSTDSTYTVKELSEISKLASTSQALMSSLPISHVSSSEVIRYLSRVEDYSGAIMKKLIGGKDLSKEEKDNFLTLAKSSRTLLGGLDEFYTSKSKDKNFKWDSKKAETYFDENKDVLMTKSLTSMTEELVDYPTMIYDGPFSDHLKDSEIKGIEGETYTKEDIEKKLRQQVGQKAEIKFNSEVNSKIKAYSFDVKVGGLDVTMNYSVKGGKLLYVATNKVPKKSVLSMKEGEKKAQKFLDELGVDEMKSTYYEKYSNIGVYNFAYIQDGVVCYSDLIKVQVSLEDGDIIGFEAMGYYTSHEKRNFPAKKISMEEARKKLSDELEITNEAVALIPTPSKNEVLCYEFKGKLKDEGYIVYISCETGKEVEIFKIIEADDSVLVL